MIAETQIPVFSSNEFAWTGYHGYLNSRDMPADIGVTDPFAVRSVRTGAVVLFQFSAVIEREGLVLGWLFDAMPADNYLSITIWNDYGTLDTNDLGNF